MNPDIFAEWLRRQGHHVVRTSSSYWQDQGFRIYQAFPYHWIIEPGEGEIRQLLNQTQALGLRYSTPLSAAQGYISYHVVYENGEYRLADLPKKARYDVRKGLKHCKVEPISMERMAREGWKLRAETLIRQGRTRAENPNWWRTLCQTAADLEGIEAWGALIDNKLAASLLAITCDRCCSILYQQSRTEFLSEGVNNALTFVFTETVLQRSNVHEIFYGLHSLDAPASVDKYKFRMNFVPNPVRQRVVFSPWISPFLNRGSLSISRFAQRYLSGNTVLSKAEGMMHFYLEGKKPLKAQKWPEALTSIQETLLASALF